MSYIFTYDPQYSHQNFSENNIKTMIKTYDLVTLKDWLKNGAPDKKRAALAFEEAIKNDWTVALDLIVSSGWSKEKKLITDAWSSLLAINLHEKNKEGSLAEQWLVTKTFNNKTLFTRPNLNKLGAEICLFACAAASQHYWRLFRPHINNLKVIDGSLFFNDIYREYTTRLPTVNKNITEQEKKQFCLDNLLDILTLSIPVNSFLMLDILQRDENEELFFKILESPLFINSQELMGLAIYVPMYFRIYQQGMKKVPKPTIDAKIERLLTALKKLNIPEYEEYTYHVINAYHSLVRQNNRQHFTAGPFDVWDHSKLDTAYHLPTLNINPNESVRVYLGDCIYAEPNSNNVYEPLFQEQKDEYRQRVKNRP